MKQLLLCVLTGLLLFFSCRVKEDRKPPGSEEVFAVRDSVRNLLLLRISRAKQEINRQVEAMRNRAYDAEPATARRLNQKVANAERSYEKLEKQIQRLANDSLTGDWIPLEQETELLINEVGRELKTSF